MRPWISIEGLRVDAGGTPVLDIERLELEGPALVQLLGPNGAGKTMTMRAILGLVKPSQGRVTVNGVDVTGDPVKAGEHIAYMPQSPRAPRSTPMTVREFIDVSLRLRGVDPERGYKALDRVGAGGVVDKRLWELSGGMLQRVFLARTLALGKPILMLDEPFSNIDPRGRHEIAGIVRREAENRLVVVTSHDPHLLLDATSVVVVLDSGRVAVEGAPGEVLTREKLEGVYGEAVKEGLIVAGEGGWHC